MNRLSPKVGVALLACCVVLLGSCSSPERRTNARRSTVAPDQVRAMWITRWDYRTQEQIERAFEDAVSLGVTDVFWQVRGQADAFYRSQLEPWSTEMLAGLPDWRDDPGFDPLDVAIARGAARGIRVHAWVNVMPLWKGKTPPTAPEHLFNARPEWRLQDEFGRAQALNDHYVIVNPASEEVHDHLVAVMRDIVTRYDVDGLHLDYIRFVGETLDQEAVYPGDRTTLRRFMADTGRRGVHTKSEREAYRAWVRDRITTLVRRIGEEVDDASPGVVVSAALWRRPDIARQTYLQDGARWLRDGFIDLGMPMIYTDNDAQFADDLNAWRQAVGDRPLVAGIGAYKHTDPAQTARQVAAAGGHGFCLFAYSTYFESADPGQNRTPAEVALRTERRRGLLRSVATVPTESP